jgi:hypothetical protein
MTSQTPPEDQGELVRQVITYPKRLRELSFALVVRESTGFNVIGVDGTRSYDKDLISTLTSKLKKSLKESKKSGRHFKGNRINDVGSKIEAAIVSDLNSAPFSVRQLGSKGYPDIEVIFNDELVYMVLKTSGVVEKSSQRYFYYSTGTKVKKSARHILITIMAESPDHGYWAVKSFVVSDLSKLKVRLKAEFNASKTQLMDEEAKIAEIA